MRNPVIRPSVSLLFICLFVYRLRKLFLKMLLFLQLSTDSFDITQESFLGSPAFGLCSAWRYGAFLRFGDLFHFRQKMVIYIYIPTRAPLGKQWLVE